ncbi:major facilitator superfamily domain-containing protein [Stachybotrys elegans]|uniref:Major facilitator superfamily domain-containing protein n=1 Tax=Stachybotrys elegans TaxID=80388 RepID=A0A8K0WXI3_9HYPO|nr:major facilitator superfamily domain-containing protein [Stachybotrys elegans]
MIAYLSYLAPTCRSSRTALLTTQHNMHSSQAQLHRARIVASVASVVISLACGTNYVYSAWAPQFAERLKLSATESNLIGLSANLGMYTMGVPIGLFVDHRGPRPAVLAGSVLLAIGYYPFHFAYDSAGGSVLLLCIFSYLSGLGGCMAFAAAVKTSALNWPRHRGTATAFPLAAFGLSAFFFSLLGSLFFPGNPSDFLLLLATGTSVMTFVGFFFLKVYPQTSYQAVPESESRAEHRLSEDPSKPARFEHDHPITEEPGTSTPFTMNAHTSPSSSMSSSSTAAAAPVPTSVAAGPSADEAPGQTLVPPEPDDGIVGAADLLGQVDVDENTSLLSSNSPDAHEPDVTRNSIDLDRSHHIDIRGFQLLRTPTFWQLFFIMAALAGVGLMTINNIGNDAKALWKKFDPTVEPEFLVKSQQMHVSILSVCSFLGRLSSGVGSDFLVKNLRASRVWCLVAACIIFLVAQIAALNTSNPNWLFIVSSLTGLGYGFLFGVSPSIVAEMFGIRGMSQNWGFLSFSPVLSSNIFNLFYGTVYDSHSVVEPSGERSCDDGLACYRSAYWTTLLACILGLATAMWVIRQQNAEHHREIKKSDEED